VNIEERSFGLPHLSYCPMQAIGLLASYYYSFYSGFLSASSREELTILFRARAYHSIIARTFLLSLPVCSSKSRAPPESMLAVSNQKLQLTAFLTIFSSTGLKSDNRDCQSSCHLCNGSVNIRKSTSSNYSYTPLTARNPALLKLLRCSYNPFAPLHNTRGGHVEPC
jgi:hypothetical protein